MEARTFIYVGMLRVPVLPSFRLLLVAGNCVWLDGFWGDLLKSAPAYVVYGSSCPSELLRNILS